jgi:glycosyltransferase A (GT-A) superfamily protein (DUF2064 family)
VTGPDPGATSDAVDRADTIIVLAKEPRPGRVKTRLQPHFRAEEASQLAAAALQDTLATVLQADVRRRVLAWEGDASGWRHGFEVVHQPPGTLNQRLEAAFAAVWQASPGTACRALLIGMDTPQVQAPDLEADWGGADAVLGPSQDGGFWTIGLQAGHPTGIFTGVPMSDHRTGSLQLARLRGLGLRVKVLPTSRDIDLAEDAEAVAIDFPELEFSRCWSALVAARASRSAGRRRRSGAGADPGGLPG